MGVYVLSQIVPERIEPEPWQALYLRTLAFLSDCPLPLMGLRRVRGQSLDRRVYSMPTPAAISTATRPGRPRA